MFKLRFYKKSGCYKGNIDHEEIFATLEEAKKRYAEVFVYKDFALNPTMWEYTNGNWRRIEGY